MMHRRDALKALAASVAAFILPAPRPRLNIETFCARLPGNGKYNLQSPYVTEDFVYATDGFACLRVRPESADVTQCVGPVPPFHTLSWDHDRKKGWRTLPRLDALMADGSDCPACCGYGHMSGDLPAVGEECETCGGTGDEWVGSNYHISHPITCRACKGSGHLPPPGAAVCAACNGKAIGRFASIVRLDGRYFDVHLYEKWRRLGAEFVHDNFNGIHDQPLLKTRVADGDGLLLGLDAEAAERRLVGEGGR